MITPQKTWDLIYPAHTDPNFWKQQNRNRHQQCSRHWQVRTSTTLSCHWSTVQGYLLKKNKWTTKTYDKVDWITLAQYLKTVPSGKLTNLLKLQHGWQQTASRNKLMYGFDSDDDNNGLCPLGCGKEEIKCVHQPGYSQVVRETNSLEKYLTTRNTRLSSFDLYDISSLAPIQH